MSENVKATHNRWSGRVAFILAATGSAVGLGNIWKFPYITGENGGGAFVLIYLACIALIGVPIMMAEILLGRKARMSPVFGFAALAREENASKAWVLLGWMGVLAGALILSYYSVIAGWAIAYIFSSLSGSFDGASANQVADIFSNLIASPWQLMAWHTLFMVMTTVVVARGVQNGIEKAVRILMPGLLVILTILVIYAFVEGEFNKGLEFLFYPNFSEIRKESILEAMGHAFFTLSLGMGAIMIYGSYLPRNVSIAKTALAVAFFDTLVALMAGMAIFPIVFANGLEASSGPGLIFQSLPIAFGGMPYGILFATLFFVLLTFAAWSSSVSLIEPLIAYLVDKKEMKRASAAVISGIIIWLVGIGTVLSFNEWSDIKFSFSVLNFHFYENATFFDVLDYLTSNLMLPLGGLLIAIFVGWSMKRKSSESELSIPPLVYEVWIITIKYVTPVAVAIVFLKSLKVIE